MKENPLPDFKPKQVRNPGLGRLAKFQNGKLTNDFAWQMLTGVPDGQQGFMYGRFDNDGKMTGDEVGKIIKILHSPSKFLVPFGLYGVKWP